jgi:hypothetical protein
VNEECEEHKARHRRSDHANDESSAKRPGQKDGRQDSNDGQDGNDANREDVAAHERL